ncbi:MAG: roadblock/LC7 domain-containing protein [candidate division KSB1 bacterium]|nr:roadblock/LC7 domain-containing protein [candidate division KSB1 bacterium]MDZ7275802.1 roadblock/LC7 domain-containing protein [candidate division KSB1 bacterium]MDZ7287554.1 roadblock/LC7 domain-containing protein [candidate division KSB1 bacterium]MDZ7308042.1 roadblock/LC7 domain-containing protein [candidate division KSB1 bacterium]MDZ7350532.1 roadblock/LC7 domain-containing protein [candidate division KSB1 bacterium]
MAIRKRLKLDRIIQGLRRDDPEVLNAVLATPDGLVIAHTLASVEAARQLAASAAALLALVSRANHKLGHGAPREIFVENTGNILYFFCTGSSILAVTLRPHTELERFLEYGRAAVKEISSILEHAISH